MSANQIPDKTPFDMFIEKNLPKVLKEQTKSDLGDRSTYIGASDIGSCLRKSYLGKKLNVEHDIAQHIVFERGHIAEGIVEKMIKGTPYKTQVEAIGKADNNFPIKAHIDFVVDFGKEIVVLEAKSTSMPVDEPYESWVLQTQLQMGLLKEKYKQKNIRGYIIAIDVNTGWYKSFKVEPNVTLFNIAIKKANELANALYKNVEPAAEIQLYCAKCPFKGNCPAITKGCEKELPINIKASMRKLKQLQGTEKEIKRIKKEIIDFMSTVNLDIAKAGDTTIQLLYSKKDEYGVDMARLKIEEPVIYAKYRTVSTDGFSWLKVI
ncbi:MAG: PD-(D/E)XK nuclease family protein [Arcobacteraceae bacterium]